MNTTMVRQAGVTPTSSVEQGADAILKLALGRRSWRARAGSISTASAKRAPMRKPTMPMRGKGCRALSLELTGLSAKEGTPS